jgi:hypothetical protein
VSTFSKILEGVTLRSLKALGSLLLLILYIVGNTQFETIHQVLHAHRVAEHSEAQEKNPCHQRIFHESKSKGCEHNVHLTGNKDCPLSHVVTHNDQLLSGQHFSDVYQFLTTKSTFVDHSIEFTFVATLPSRAPPLA